MFQKVIFYALLMPSFAWAYACPSLKGTYTCPGSNESKDFTLIITQKFHNDERSSASYFYDYPELGFPILEVLASTKGELNQSEKPYWGQCVRQTLIYFNQNSTNGYFQTTQVSKGNLEVFVRGKKIITCLKKKEN